MAFKNFSGSKLSKHALKLTDVIMSTLGDLFDTFKRNIRTPCKHKYKLSGCMAFVKAFVRAYIYVYKYELTAAEKYYQLFKYFCYISCLVQGIS